MSVPISHSPSPSTFILNRSRIFETLERNLDGKLTWISAPAGCGKTTLVSSFVEFRSNLCFWYKVGENDDAECIFRRIVNVVAAKGIDVSSVPTYHPHSQKDLSRFSSDFFQSIFLSVPGFSIWVWEDFHRAKFSADFFLIFGQYLESIPKSSHCFVTSRESTPVEFVAHTVKAGCFYMGYNDLKFNKKEVKELLILNNVSVGEKGLSDILTYTGGWAIGVKFLVGSFVKSGRFELPKRMDSESYLFKYFSNIVFENLEDSEKAELAKLSLAPQFNMEIVERLCDSMRVKELIKGLVEGNCFLSRCHGTNLNYEFHSLYCDFLREKLDTIATEDEIDSFRSILVDYYLSENIFDKAIEMLMVTKDSDSIDKFIGTYGLKCFDEGRLSTLEAIISIGKFNEKEFSAATLMLDGVINWFKRPEASMKKITQALEQFINGDDDLGLSICWFVYANHSTMYWQNIDEIDKIFPKVNSRLNKYVKLNDAGLDAERIKLKYFEGIVAFAVYSARAYHILRDLVCEAETYALHRNDPNESPLLYRNLYVMNAFGAMGGGVQDRLVQYLDKKNYEIKFTPLLEYVKGMNECQHSFLKMDLEKCEAILKKIEIIRDRDSIRYHAPILDSLSIRLKILQNRPKDAEADFIKYWQQSHCQTPASRAYYFHLRSWQALNQGGWKEALDFSESSLKNISKSEMTMCLMAAIFMKAVSCIYNGLYADADDQIGRYESMLVSTEHLTYYDLLLVKSFYYFKKGEFALAIGKLQEAIRKAIELRYVVSFYPVYPMLSELYTFALENDIYSDYISNQIRVLALENNNRANEFWPRKIRVYSSAGLKIRLNNTRVDFGKKAPKKVMDLLKTILIFGGLRISVNKLCEQLWPESDGDSARRSFDTTMHRLRKVLGRDVISVEAGFVSVDPKNCWLDLWSLDEALDILKKYPSSFSFSSGDVEAIEKQVRRVKMYFPVSALDLDDEVLSSAYKERKSNVVACLLAVADLALSSHNQRVAATIYQLCIDMDPNNKVAVSRRSSSCNDMIAKQI